MEKKKFIIMLLMVSTLLWAGSRIFAQSQEQTQPQSHDSAAVIERAERRITPEQRKAAALRAAEARAQKVLETTSSDTTSNDSTSSDTTNSGNTEGGTTNE